MITDRPCCDNCPHYDPDAPSSATATYGQTNDDSGYEVPVRGCCRVDLKYEHVDPNDRCANHPWVARVTSEAVANYAASWREYIDDLPLLLDVLAGGGDKGVREEDQ